GRARRAEAEPLPDADLPRQDPAGRLARPRRGAGSVPRLRGRRGPPGGPPEDGHARPGQGLDGSDADRLGPAAQARALGLDQALAALAVSAAAPTRKLIAATRPEEAAAVLAARHGPPDDRPALRKNLSVRRQVQMGDVNWIVKNPATMKYYMFRDAEWALLRLFDGTRTRAEILEAYNARVRDPASLN